MEIADHESSTAIYNYMKTCMQALYSTYCMTHAHDNNLVKEAPASLRMYKVQIAYTCCCTVDYTS